MSPVVLGCHFLSNYLNPDGLTRAKAAIGGGVRKWDAAWAAPETDLTPDGVLEYGVMEYDSPAP